MTKTNSVTVGNQKIPKSKLTFTDMKKTKEIKLDHCSGCTDPDPYGATHQEGTIEHPIPANKEVTEDQSTWGGGSGIDKQDQDGWGASGGSTQPTYEEEIKKILESYNMPDSYLEHETKKWKKIIHKLLSSQRDYYKGEVKQLVSDGIKLHFTASEWETNLINFISLLTKK
jgi:hypothetical protein